MKSESKYQETKERLINKIKNKEIIGLTALAENHVCYFCCKKINGKMRILREAYLTKGNALTETNYYLHEGCYEIMLNPCVLN